MQSLKYISGEGNINSPILMFIGECPGEKELEENRPFVGRSGNLLNKWIKYLNFARSEVYITNVIKVYSEGNRTPTFEELISWRKLLIAEIDRVNPKIIITVGSSATKTLLNKDFKEFAPHRGVLEETYTLFPIYHPAYILRNPGAEKIVMADLDKLKEIIGDFSDD